MVRIFRRAQQLGETVMDAEISENFFVTLPSNSSFEYFPKNTQSSFKTKLSSPLVLNGNWEVGLSEIFIPRNWFNVNDHNNAYSVTYKTEETVLVKYAEHKITFEYEKEMDKLDFCDALNHAVLRKMGDSTNVSFAASEIGSNITVQIENGYELNIKADSGAKLLYMFNMAIEDAIVTETTTFKYRPSTQYPLKIEFYVLNRNPKKSTQHIVPANYIKGETKPIRTAKDLADVFDYNLGLLGMQHVALFTADSSKSELSVRVADNVEILLSKHNCPSLLKKLLLNDDMTIRKQQTFKVDPSEEIIMGEALILVYSEYYESLVIKTHREDLKLNVGMYATPAALFEKLQLIHLTQLPDFKVVMRVPVTHEVTLGKGLADMLGFEHTTYGEGVHVSKYPLELDGGITEIFVYCDIISSHHCGDAFLPLLRIVPCLGEHNNQIVKNYQRPLYFPIRKHYIETIQIELRTSSGDLMTFSSGKTFAVLSFRHRKL